MNKRLFALCAVGIFGFYGFAAAVPAESRIFTPYFNMSMMQGAFLPTKGNFFAGANVGMSVGLLSRITEDHAIFALYNLGFSGEGFRFPDTKEFASKELSHNFNGEYRWDIFDWLRIRPGASYGTNFTRTAAGEIWGSGLYDSKVYGGSLALDYKFGLFGQNATLTGQGVYRILNFPNYTDIIREFKGLSANTESAGTLKNQKGMEANASFSWSRFFSRIRYAVTTYDKEKVVESNGTYGARSQEDTKVILEGGFRAKLWIFELSPNASYTRNRSNQNYLLFKSVTDIAPAFLANYYDYNELGFEAPLFLNFTKKWALNGAIDYRRRDYTQRQPKDGSNQFIDGTQSNNMVTLTAGFRKKLNDISALTLTYSSVVATSNNKFEKYTPYNYTGQSVAIGYHLTY